ncbi:MAG: hypothetical protein QOE38_579 [Thermoleophilaceae bacterium]|nr:hypothetical protein [Thermoleophilaceae bacterium]
MTLRSLERLTRPKDPELEALLRGRWESLPERVRVPGQALGRRTMGCEGTHGVFPRCDLACTPCYHSRDANRVRVDGAHTVASIDRQMAYLRRVRGPGQNAQLIGGEVTLLSPSDHAEALLVMRRHGRKPMSMSHGDFDYSYLRAMVLGPDGKPRFRWVSFAGHFDSMMLGRRGLRRASSEAELDPYRERFCQMFERLQRETGVRSYLAHNMTVTPGNIDEVASVVRSCRDMGFRMLSFQPAAFIGNTARWKHPYRSLTADSVWEEISAGAGARLPHRVFQFGDERCNRTAYGALVGPSSRWVPFLDDRVPADMRVRESFFETFGGMDFDVPPLLLGARLARAFAEHPLGLARAGGWAGRFARRAGGVRAVLGSPRPRALTFVMHNFMDAAVVRPAWELLQRGETSADPEVLAAQERLQACSYAMAHPESDMLVPACAQHGVLDPDENRELALLLPMARPGSEPDARVRRE